MFLARLFCNLTLPPPPLNTPTTKLEVLIGNAIYNLLYVKRHIVLHLISKGLGRQNNVGYKTNVWPPYRVQLKRIYLKLWKLLDMSYSGQ